MEEKKNVKMKAVNNEGNKQQKLSYEQLNDACMQLYQQNQQLQKQLQKANAVNMFARLEFLFKVLNYASAFKDDKFVADCAAEIKNAMAIGDRDDKED